VGIIETSAALGACLLVLTIAVVLDRRPYRPGKRNYIPVMIIALAASTTQLYDRRRDELSLDEVERIVI